MGYVEPGSKAGNLVKALNYPIFISLCGLTYMSVNAEKRAGVASKRKGSASEGEDKQKKKKKKKKA